MKKTEKQKSVYLCGEKDAQTEVIPKFFENFLKKQLLYIILLLLVILLLFMRIKI